MLPVAHPVVNCEKGRTIDGYELYDQGAFSAIVKWHTLAYAIYEWLFVVGVCGKGGGGKAKQHRAADNRRQRAA